MVKKWLVILMCALLAVAVFGCAGQGKSQVKLGIIQIAEHPSLDQARKGFLDVLRENGYKEGENLIVDYQNAQGDIPTANTIAQKFVSDRVDMVLAIATPAAQAMAAATKEIPILITAVTDPVAAELVQSMERPGTNVTGTTDMNPVKEQLDLFGRLKPGIKRVGVLYNSSETNSVVQVNLARSVAPELGLTLVEKVVTNSSEVRQAAESLVNQVDGIYVPTDNTVVSALPSVISVCEEHDIPLIVGEADSVERGGLATYGIDYYKLGRQTGEMALKILKEGAKPAEMPVESQKEYTLTINLKAAQAMGVEVPEDLLAKAQVIQ